jgi:NAD(P)-dependent dehydrogenase (short-subunit alcohol dehydrogenase family)
MERFTGKVVIVTGGASGIGEATARSFAAQGAKVIIADIADLAGQTIIDDLNRSGMTARFLHVDATREDDQRELIAFAVSEFGRLDIAINVVGNIDPRQDTLEMLHEELLEMFMRAVDLNLGSCFLGMKYQIRQMLKQGGGVIANTSSMAGLRVSDVTTAGYSAAKAGVIHLTEYAAVRYARENIRVNVIAPGATATRNVLSVFSEEKLLELAHTQPMGKLMRPEDMANAFAWVCSDEAAGVTGLTIPVAGGWAAV